MFPSRDRKGAVGVLLFLLFLGLPARAQSVQVHETYGDQSKLLQRRATDLLFAPGGPQVLVDFNITVDDTVNYQTMDGFGASLTHSAGSVIANHLNLAQRRALFRLLFDPAYGAGITLLRQPMGASDFSARGNYSYHEQNDPALTQFTIAPDQEFLTWLLREGIAANPSLRLMAMPWSPPWWMKGNGSMNGGNIRTDLFAPLAQYFVKFLQAYQQEKLPIYALTAQNEPLYATTNYPTAFMSAADEATFIGKHLGPALAAAGFGDTKILAYDHNWDHPEYANTVLNDADASQYSAGAAFHCYGGNVSAQNQFKAQHPDKDVWFTECSGTVGSQFAGDLAWNSRNLMIGATRNWARSVILWNIALDQNSGPKNGGCSNCRGVATIDYSVTPPVVSTNVEYYVLGQLAKFVRPGAVRVDSNSGSGGSIMDVAFRNPDGSIVLLVLNDAPGTRTFALAWRGNSLTYTLPPQSVATMVWNTPTPAFPSNGVVNAAQFEAGLSPGALMTLYGTRLAAETVSAPFFPLASTMGATSVTVNGRAAPLVYLSPGQINAQLPWETEVGTANMTVTRNGVSTSHTVTVAAAAPGIFTVDGTRAAALNEDNSANSADNPVLAGRTAILFATGLGPANPAVGTGEATPLSPHSLATGVVRVELGGQSVIPDFAGLAPLYAGLFQVNFLVPATIPTGPVQVRLIVNGVGSNLATIAVRYNQP